MTGLTHLLAFRVEGQRVALLVGEVERVVRAVQVTPLPGAPEDVLGVISVQGRITPVINLRKRFGLPDRRIEPRDLFVIAHSDVRTVALPVDSAEVVELDAANLVSTESVVLESQDVAAIAKRDDGLLLVCALDHLLSHTEGLVLDSATRAG